MSRIAIDSMGGDHAPGALVEGAVLAARETRSELILVGDKKRIERELGKFEDKLENLSIQHCSEWIEMGEAPVTALRKKKDSSILVGMRIMKSSAADAIVTA
ncbi:MAG: phosphate acyltransferase, partial [Candidatus Hydrogenedentes bacterium]|nr:phosphate acyltransferase [Candidatus Hydrogenedentota bacterium]